MISDLKLFCSQVMLDTALEQSFAQVLLSNRALTVPLRTVTTQVQNIPNGSTSFQISLVSVLSWVNAIFVTFTFGDGQHSHPVASFGNPSAVLAGGGAAAHNHQELTLSMQCQLGSRLSPETEITSAGEFMANLAEALDTYDQSIRTIAITPSMYKNNSFIAGFNLMRAPVHFATGLSTRTDDLLSIKCKNLNPGAAFNHTRVHVSVLYEGVLELEESGASFYD